MSISGGSGFLRGEIYDDSKGLPLAGATISLLSDGGGALAAPTEVTADERGRFSLSGRSGDAIVRIRKSGFGSVERRGVIPVNGPATLLDARLTPVDPHVNLIGSAIGGQARDQAQRATLQIPPGGLTADASITMTLISAQGLEGVLPAGWSPVAAISIDPGDIVFGFPLTLTLPNPTTLPQDTALTVARYDRARHEWIAAGAATPSPTGLTLSAPVDRFGQFAVLVPDAAPFTPAAPVSGQALSGVDRAANPAGLTAAGDVVPRSAPPGDGARAVGRVGLHESFAACRAARSCRSAWTNASTSSIRVRS